jgi:hypothetical protein
LKRSKNNRSQKPKAETSNVEIGSHAEISEEGVSDPGIEIGEIMQILEKPVCKIPNQNKVNR